MDIWPFLPTSFILLFTYYWVENGYPQVSWLFIISAAIQNLKKICRHLKGILLHLTMKVRKKPLRNIVFTEEVLLLQKKVGLIFSHWSQQELTKYSKSLSSLSFGTDSVESQLCSYPSLQIQMHSNILNLPRQRSDHTLPTFLLSWKSKKRSKQHLPT